MKQIEIKTTALVMRVVNGNNGKKMLQIFGSGFELPEFINESEDFLVIGSLIFESSHIFKGFKNGEGNTPDNMLKNGCLNHRNYKEKL